MDDLDPPDLASSRHNKPSRLARSSVGLQYPSDDPMQSSVLEQPLN